MLESKTPFYLDTFVKSISTLPDGDLIIRGFASTWVKDRDHDILNKGLFEKALPGYQQNPVLLLNHDIHKPIGKIINAEVTNKGLFVEALIPKPVEDWALEAYNKIRDGIYKAFSIGGIFNRVGNTIKGIDWAETSVVAVPSNPETLFEVAEKAFNLLDFKALTANLGGDGGGRARGGSTTVTLSPATLANLQSALADLQTLGG